jgi:hypothetical protein
MNWRWASFSIAILALAATSASPAPRAGNPCKQMRHNLDRQIDDLKVQQKDELQQCEISNGGSSDECLLLKDRQQQALRAMRDDRTLQMSNCSGRGSFAGLAVPIVADLNASCVNQSYSDYPDNDEYDHKVRDPHHRHHHPHYPSTEIAAKAGSAGKGRSVDEKSGGKNPHANTLTADSNGRNAAPSAGHNYGGRNESAGSHNSSSLSSAGGSSSHSTNASFGSSHSSGAGSSFSGGTSSSHSSAASSSSSSSSSSSNSSGGHH